MLTKLNSSQITPNFGMAFKVKYSDNSTKAIVQGTAELKNYMGFMKSHTTVRGYKQLKNQLKSYKYYDVVFDITDKSANVVNKSTGDIVTSFKKSPIGVTGIGHLSELNYGIKEIFIEIFNPKKFLPQNINSAYDSAKNLEKTARKEVKIIKKLDKLS